MMLPNSEKYLYRGLRKEEVETGFRLIPKGVESFTGPMFVMADHSGTYFHRGGAADVMVRHQADLPTSGISTSTSFEVAKHYANQSPIGFRFVVRIRRDLLSQFEIREFNVNQLLGLRTPKPKNYEVILESRTGAFPKEIIDEISPIDGE